MPISKTRHSHQLQVLRLWTIITTFHLFRLKTDHYNHKRVRKFHRKWLQWGLVATFISQKHKRLEKGSLVPILSMIWTIYHTRKTSLILASWPASIWSCTKKYLSKGINLNFYLIMIYLNTESLNKKNKRFRLSKIR